jgi:hypothetical protein
VDQLYEVASPEAVEEWTERERRERKLDAKATAGLSVAGIANLFGGEIAYGSGSVVEKEQKRRVRYVEKLRDVLLTIAADHGEIPALADCLQDSAFGLYIHHAGTFQVTEPVTDTRSDQIVTLRSAVDATTLLLDCSLKFFSSADEQGRLLVHSGNFRFFERQMPLNLETVFIFLNRDGGEIVGSPLYLRLQVDETDVFAMPAMI